MVLLELMAVPNGDLYITFMIKEDSRYQRKEINNLM